ncbi:uncharacterized protein LOC106665169 [Cimex lectularius]|uniref:Uncharacterized protein n=1 Tax=Cimex lectularius TaxID=79782 RepID=A0A8I6RRM8_CIMLE|nr:uncharacterized protein LOC106665169 [Cimex lectularius]
MITCEKFCQFEINHLFEIESTVSINHLWAIIIFICTRRYIKNITLMGSKNSVLKNNNTPSGKNEGNTIQHVFKKGYPVSSPNIPEKPFVPNCKVNEKSHENVGSFSEKSFHIKDSNVSNINLKDCGNLVSEVGFGGDIINMKKPTKKHGSKSRSQISATNKGNVHISKPSINNPQKVLANNGDTTGNKYGTEEEKEPPSCNTDSSDLEADELDDELYYLIFGEHFNSCQHPKTECLPLSLSEEILNYIDKNQRFVNDDECGFVKKCFMENKFGKSNNRMINRTDVLDKACSTNPASDIIRPNSLNVAFIKGMIYRRELYGPPIEQVGQAGPSQPQVPFGTQEYVITKRYNYGRDDPQTSMPGNRNFGCSCAGSCNNDFGMRLPPTTNQLSLFDQSPMEDHSSKNAVKLEDVTEKKIFKLNQSNKTSNKKVSGKKRSLVKKVISKKGIGKKTTTALKPKPLASQKGTERNIKRKQFTKNATSAKKPTKKTKNYSRAKNVVSDKSVDDELPSTSNNLCGCKCEWPWGNDFGQCPPCPPNHLSLFKQRFMKEENCKNIIAREKQNEADDEKKNFDSVKGYKKKSSRTMIEEPSRIDDEVVNLEQLDKVSKKKADREKKPATAMSESRASKKKKSSKTTRKQGEIDENAFIKFKKKSRKSKESSPSKIEDDELRSMSKSSLKTKVKPVSIPNNNVVDLINKNDYGKSEKEGISNRVGATKTDDLKYDILFRDDGNIKVKVEKFISGKSRVFTYNSGNDCEEKSKEEKTNQTLPPQQNTKISEIADSQKPAKKLNLQVTIPKSLFKQKNITKVRSIDNSIKKSSLGLSNSSAVSNDSSLLHPKATTTLNKPAFVHPSALAAHTDKDDAANKRDQRRKDTNISFEEHVKPHHDSEVRKLSPSMFYESLHPILEEYHSRDVGPHEDPNYTAEVHTEKCVVEGNKIECLTSIPHVRAVFEIPGTHAKKTETYIATPKIAPSQNDIHVDVGLDRVGPKFLEQMGHKGVPYGSIKSNENVLVKGDSHNFVPKPDHMEDEHYKRPLKVLQYRPSLHSVESSQMNTVFTEKKDQLNEPNKLNSKLYDANKLYEIQECLSKMKLELRNDCPCLASSYEVTRKNIDKDSKRKNGSKEWYTESDSGSDKKKGDLHKLATEMLENKQNQSKKNISIIENEEGKKYLEDRDPNLKQKYFSGSKQPHDDSLDSENIKRKKYVQSINDKSKLRESNVANSKSLKKPSLDQNKPNDYVTFKNASNGIKDADGKKKLKFRKRQPTGIFFQELNLLKRSILDDDSVSTTNEENSRRYKRSELSGVNKNGSYGTRINRKISKGRSTMNHPKSTVTDIKSFGKKTSGKKKPRKDERVAESDSTSDDDEHILSFRKRQPAGVYHQGRNLRKGATSYNDSRKYKAKTIKDINEGYSSTSRLNTRKKKEYSNTTFEKEIPRYSSRVQRKTERKKFSKFLDMSNADTLNSSDSTTGSRKLAKVGRLKKGKTAESKLRTPSARPRKMSQEKNRSNGVTVDKLWADHRLEKSILTERFNQTKRILNSKCPSPDMAMKCCCSPVCPPKVLICQYRCPSSYRPP